VSEAELRAALARQTGEIDQVPPAYSAKRVEGERMYALARRGEAVEPPPVRVTVHAAELVRFDPPDAEFVVDCSSGTYIRAIARDVGRELGVGAHLRALRRTRVGAFQVEGAIAPESLEDPAAVERALVAPGDAVAHLPATRLAAEAVEAMRHGRAVPAGGALPEGVPVAVYGGEGALVAIGERLGDALRPRKVFA
jgi:tRNA pseudouridine55 synthase